jgi:MFS family permease
MSRWTDKFRPHGSPLAVAVMFIGKQPGDGLLALEDARIRDQVGATPTSLAFALVCVGIGSIVSMPFTGLLADRYSSMAVSRAATVICLAAWALVPLANSVPTLALIMLIAGLGTGVGDVAMNIQGNVVEQRRNKVPQPCQRREKCLAAALGRSPLSRPSAMADFCSGLR